jgi:hypothetical protein
MIRRALLMDKGDRTRYDSIVFFANADTRSIWRTILDDELVNQNELIEKYGSYLLSMIHMIKYGISAGGLVPPLLELNHATRIDTGQEHLQFIKKTIKRLVDDTITHLKEATGVTNSETTVDQKVDNTEV